MVALGMSKSKIIKDLKTVTHYWVDHLDDPEGTTKGYFEVGNTIKGNYTDHQKEALDWAGSKAAPTIGSKYFSWDFFIEVVRCCKNPKYEIPVYVKTDAELLGRYDSV